MIFVLSPVIGIIIGVGVFLLFRAAFRVKLERRQLLIMVVFSLILSLLLTFEESGWGIIHNQYDKYIDTANEVEGNKAVHEIELGCGKILYFYNHNQDSFELNFEYQGTNNITKTQIVELAESYCLQQNYEVENIGEIFWWDEQYSKSGLFIKGDGGGMDIEVEIKNGPIDNDRGGYQLTGFYLGLSYSDNQLQLVETGVYSWSPP